VFVYDRSADLELTAADVLVGFEEYEEASRVASKYMDDPQALLREYARRIAERLPESIRDALSGVPVRPISMNELKVEEIANGETTPAGPRVIA
jgi:hypothetical protein